jgi:hypothetical protein
MKENRHGVMKMAAKMKEMAAIMAQSRKSRECGEINEEAGIIRRGVAIGWRNVNQCNHRRRENNQSNQ